MEKKIKLPTKDNHIIYGTLNSFEEKKDKLIVFVHGLSGSQNEHHYFNAVPYFCTKGFDTFRFNLYSGADKARQLSECTITIHAQDLQTVINNFQDKYKELYLVGHSLGGLTIMNTDTSNISKIIQWDPSAGIRSTKDNDMTFNETTGYYTLHRGIEIKLNKQMVKEWKDAANTKEYSKKITKNTSFIFAGNYHIYESWKPYINDYKYSVIEGASHVFIEEGAEKQLFDRTLKYLKN